MSDAATLITPGPRVEILYYFCRLQMPSVELAPLRCQDHLQRTFALYQKKVEQPITWEAYLDHLYPLDWFLASACLEGNRSAWDHLFASRAGRSDCLLMDALRARAARLYPRDDERQDTAVADFWGHLCIAETEGSLPVMARFDGQRPLVPWLIRVFQNWHISQLRKHPQAQALPDDDLAMPMPTTGEIDARWREVFSEAARDWLSKIDEEELLLLGLRIRYRLSQREVAQLLKVHEGTISRRTDHLRDQCLEYLAKQLAEAGWTGDDIFELVRTEMIGLLLDDPRLSADALGLILAKKGKKIPGPS
ncbi:MAG: sigma-70 family RNA polymerase sigma factor [Planctomycetes bacterium]|nr:sigma-70 family RNA polymerase sigma factor [Planctomycetota bacterium]